MALWTSVFAQIERRKQGVRGHDKALKSSCKHSFFTKSSFKEVAEQALIQKA
jgi:hypothetical protein